MPPKSAPANEIHLTLGSKYRVLSLGSRDERLESKGTFKGVVSIGTIDAVAIQLDATHGEYAGKLRVIPSHMLLAVDIVEQAESEEEKAMKDDPHIHYG